MAVNVGSSAVSLYLGSQAVNAYLGGTLVTPPLARTLYFTGVVYDGDWSNLSNWSDNAEGTVAASSLPAAGDSVIATTNIGVVTGDAPTVANFTMNDPENNAHYCRIVITVTGMATFNGSSYNDGSISGDATFNDSSYNAGSIGVDATFNDSSYNAGSIGVDATFNDSSYNDGSIGGDATFTASSYDSYPQQGAVYGDVVFTNVTVGCTDPDADNYNSSATLDDGSCTYPPPPEE